MPTIPLNEIGRLFHVGIQSTKLSGEERKALKALSPGGLIFFAKNFTKKEDWQSDFKLLREEARSLCAREKLLVSIDHEGGRVHRLPEPATHFPAANTWKGKEAAVAKAMGEELSQLGFNLSFAPVLDTLSEPSNKVIGDRSFSCEATEVAAPALAFASSIEEAGVLSCGKHFPGHGATWADSHEELPVLNIDRELLECRELAPFREYIAADFQMMMMAHVIYPAIDPELPASLSPRHINDLLREELGYQGVIISDDLEMKALEHLELSERVVMSFRAGTDILLIGNHPTESPIIRALRAATVLQELISNSDALRKRYEETRERLDRLDNRLESIKKNNELALGCEKHSKLNEQLRNA